MPKGIKGYQIGHETSSITRKKIGDALRKPVPFNCDYCQKQTVTSPSKYKRNNRHFCSRSCQALFRKERLPFTEQPSYMGVRKTRDSKQIYHKRYADSHKTNIAHLKSLRYARERGAVGSHTIGEWEKLKALHKNKCADCGDTKPLTKDHIIPLSKGGSNYIENIQPLCRNCNSKKHNKIIHENPELLN